MEEKKKEEKKENIPEYHMLMELKRQTQIIWRWIATPAKEYVCQQ